MFWKKRKINSFFCEIICCSWSYLLAVVDVTVVDVTVAGLCVVQGIFVEVEKVALRIGKF